MQTATIEKRQYAVVESNPIALELKAFREDLEGRGFEPIMYVLKGKRGAIVTALRSSTTGEFVKVY